MKPREIVSQARDGLVELLRACREPGGLALLMTTMILVTRESAGDSRLLLRVWAALSLTEPLLQHQVVAVVLQLVVPVLVIWLVHRRQVREFGLGLGRTGFWLPITLAVFAVQVPVVVLYLSRDPVYRRRYPSLQAARGGGALFWGWEGSRALYMISWEFLFRGYLLFALQPTTGQLASVVQMVPFVLMHMVSRKPISEVYFTVGSGLLSGVFALLARSAWPIIWLHAAGAILLDICIVYR